MSTAIDVDALLDAGPEGPLGPAGLAPLLAALGFAPAAERVPREAWSAYGLGGAGEVRGIAVAGRAGSLVALHIEVEPGYPSDAARLAARVRARNPARLYLYLLEEAGSRRLTIGTFGLEGGFHHLGLERDRVRPSDRSAIEEMIPAGAESGLELAVKHAAALDRTRITRRFFRDFRARRSAIADAWSGIPAVETRERAQLALLLLSRLTFLYFLQRRGSLAGDDAYLPRLLGRWSASGGSTFYRSRLVPLFFGVLNRRPDQRTGAARELGPLPYLNGGLFEPHPLERRYRALDLPDREIRACLDELYERYRFTSREAGEGAGYGVDPEVLGRVFEGLMEPGDRGDTGSYYTPAPVVDRVVREAVATYVAGPCARHGADALVDGDAAGLSPAARHRVRATLERVRILDPACGSGAFLLGALQRVALALGGVSEESASGIRRRLVARSLHGVDLLDDAALLCALRLWLALTVADDQIRPLPNLDRRIRQGDALVDPLDLEAAGVVDPDGPRWHPLQDPDVRSALRAIEPAGRRYLEAGPDERERLRSRLDLAERRLARRWLRGARAAHADRLRRLRARAGDRDLFGETTADAQRASAAIGPLQARVLELDALAAALDEKGALPFFSFGVHFADAAAGFDLVVSNPPWVRAHRWPDRVRKLSHRFEVCRGPGSARVAALSGAPAGAGAQVDLSLLFLERSVRLLAPGGVLAMLLPAKALRTVYGGAARRLIMRELELVLIEDHALDQRSVFRADAFVAVLIARKRPPGTTTARPGPGDGVPDPADGVRTPERLLPGERSVEGPQTHPAATRRPPVRIHLVRRGMDPLEIEVDPRDLPLFPDDPASPWILAPPEVVSVLRCMQAAGPPLGEHGDLRVRRGVMTGANDVLLFSTVEPKLGGLARVEAEGYRRARRAGRSRSVSGRYRAVVELDGLRPLVRGADIAAFRYRTTTWTTWCHDGEGAASPPPARLRRYLERHRRRLETRSGWKQGRPLGSLFRLTPNTLQPKVAWHDLSDSLGAVALPARVRREGADRELVPLNTVYFVPLPDPDDAVVLAGILNSLPASVAARAVAERAKDARFRFLAWTVASIPLPARWRCDGAVAEIGRISQRAHAAGGIDRAERRRLDRAVARLYGLSDAQLETLARFDQWLRGMT